MIYTTVLPTFESVNVISTVAINSTYPVLQFIDHSENVISTHVVGTTTTINSVTYTTTSNAVDLNFASTLTTEGVKYVFMLNETTLGKKLSDGIFKIKLISATEEPVELLVFLYKSIQCCVAKKLSKLNCSTDESVVTITAIILATESAANSGLQNEAVCGYNILTSYCTDCGCL
jgi:hypothetical protein